MLTAEKNKSAVQIAVMTALSLLGSNAEVAFNLPSVFALAFLRRQANTLFAHTVTHMYTTLSKIKIIASKIKVLVMLLIVVPLVCKANRWSRYKRSVQRR